MLAFLHLEFFPHCSPVLSFRAFALSSAAQYLSNFSVLRITREIVEIHLPGPQSQRFCFGGLGEEPWDVLLNWPHHPF